MSGQKALVFIVSGGRTGTMFLARHLGGMISGALAVHQPDLFDGFTNPDTWRKVRDFGVYHMIIGRALGRTGPRLIAREYLSGRLSSQAAISQIRRSRQHYFSQRPESLIIESNNQWAPIMPLLRKAFPKAKMVCITRDEEAWIQSWLRKGDRYTNRDWALHSRLDPSAIDDEASARLWPTMTTEEKLRWEWHFINDRLESFASADPCTRLYRFEDLFEASDREQHFRTLLHFIATHGARHFPVRLDPTVLSRRENAAT